MIHVVVTDQTRQFMKEIGVSESRAVETVNNRHCGLVDKGATRIAAIHWFDDGQVVFVDSRATKKDSQSAPDGQTLTKFEEVTANVVLLLRQTLPAGRIDKSMDMKSILAVIAASFGDPLHCHPNEPQSTLYSGPWDGTIQGAGSADRHLVVSGTFWPAEKHCELVYALDVGKYKTWLAKS